MIRRRPVATSLLLLGPLVLASLTTGCASRDAAPGGSAPPSVTAAPGSTVATVPSGGRAKLAGFGEVTVTVVAADGRSKSFCLLLADVEELRQQGLMFVTDPALGGYDGMLFVFETDQTGGFWMKNTRLPLSIAWLRDDGSTTSTAAMAPCPDTTATCPTYPSGGTYRYAIEVAQGGLDTLGLSDKSHVTVGPKSCPPA